MDTDFIIIIITILLLLASQKFLNERVITTEAGPMAAEQLLGLTSVEACSRLAQALHGFVNNQKWKHNLWRDVCLILPSLIASAITLLCGVLLMAAGCATSSDTDYRPRTAVLSLVLLLFTVLNLVLTLRDIHLMRTWHVSQLYYRTRPALFTQATRSCPWTPSSYPSNPISTLRGQVTVPAIRDEVVVNVPISLLVTGDIIQCPSGLPVPANVTSLSDASISYSLGELASASTTHDDKSRATITCDAPRWFRVIDTPVLSYLQQSAVTKTSPLEKEIYIVQALIIYVLLPIVFLVTFIANIIRYSALPDYFTSWQQVIISWSIYALLPLLSVSFHVVRVIMTSYAVAKVSLLLDSSDAADISSYGIWITVKRFFVVVFVPSRFILPCVVDFFGYLTSLSAIDKEYVLTGALPTPEKVFFLRGKQSSEHGAMSSKTSLVSQKNTSRNKTSEQQSSDDNVSSCSSESDDNHIEVIPEVMDIHVSSTPGSTESGLEFDDPNWHEQLDSLKPIGVNSLTTSHVLQSSKLWPPSLTSVGLRQYLNKTQCVCSLGQEVGVRQYVERLEQQQIFYLLSDTEHDHAAHVSTIPRKGYHTVGSDLIQPHLISTIFNDSLTGVQLLMSRGSGDIVAWCCCDFWDGKDLQPVGEMERMAILDFFTRRSLTSHCIALAYNPLLDSRHGCSLHSVDPMGVYVPYRELKNCLSEKHILENDSSPDTRSALELMCNQVFLGMISLQYHPKPDVVNLVQALRKSGIRFIHFTAENELRGKIFAEKLGLEAGWNCHISLSPGTEDDSLSEKSFDDSSSTSTSSSLNSVINAFQSYVRAKLPKGIDKIRPHLVDVDNVPLLVPLFTDCTPNAVGEMINIMQDNGEVVLCMGNPWVCDNLPLFSRAEIGLSLLPSPEDTCACLHDKTHIMADPSDDHWPSPLDLMAAINSYTCDISLSREADVSLQAVVTCSRHLLGCMQRLLLFGFGCSLSVAIVLLISHIFFLPPPLSGGHVYWLVLIVIPVLSLSLLSTHLDPTITKQMPDRRNKITTKERSLLLLYFMATYLPSAVVFIIVFAAMLTDLCNLVASNDCHSILGNTNYTAPSNSNTVGWLTTNRRGLVLAQDCTCLLFTLTFLALSLRFVHRTEPFWRLWKYVSWQYITTFIMLAVLQVVYCVISQVVQYSIWSISQVPVYVWILFVIWPLAQVMIQELLKSCDRRRYVKTQRRLRLSFETKLGMNSPF